MTLGSRLRRLLFVCPLVGVVAGMSLASGRTASADTADKTELNERCATRLSIALLGRSPDATLFSSATPPASVNGMLLSQDVIERFSRVARSLCRSSGCATGNSGATRPTFSQVNSGRREG